MRIRDDLGPFPIWLWISVGVVASWYVWSRHRGQIRPASVQAVIVDAIDEPHERAELVRGIATGLLSAVLSFYLLRRWGRMRP